MSSIIRQASIILLHGAASLFTCANSYAGISEAQQLQLSCDSQAAELFSGEEQTSEANKCRLKVRRRLIDFRNAYAIKFCLGKGSCQYEQGNTSSNLTMARHLVHRWHNSQQNRSATDLQLTSMRTWRPEAWTIICLNSLQRATS